MSIKVIIQAPGLNLQASVKDEALTELIKITQEYRDQESAAATAPFGTSSASEGVSKTPSPMPAGEEALKAELSNYGAAELLNRVRWETYPEKILLLGGWNEARGGTVPWKSADMEAVFMQAKERPPGNFPRDIKMAIKSGWIHTHTPRTYSVTRTGWNKIAETFAALQ